jgi:hypothetical protein
MSDDTGQSDSDNEQTGKSADDESPPPDDARSEPSARRVTPSDLEAWDPPRPAGAMPSMEELLAEQPQAEERANRSETQDPTRDLPEPAIHPVLELPPRWRDPDDPGSAPAGPGRGL